MGWSIDTDVMLPDGTRKRIGNLLVGEQIVNGFGESVAVTRVSAPYSCPNHYKIEYKSFWGTYDDSTDVKTERFITPDQVICAAVTLADARIYRNRQPDGSFYWDFKYFAHCNRMQYDSAPNMESERTAIGTALNRINYPSSSRHDTSIQDDMPLMYATAIEQKINFRWNKCKKGCNCGLIQCRTLSFRDANIPNAMLPLSQEPLFPLLDPRMAFNGDAIFGIPDVFCNGKHKNNVKTGFISLIRNPLQVYEGTGESIEEPYAVGLWFGDGHSNCLTIASSEEPVINHLKQVVTRLNSNKPEGKMDIRLDCQVVCEPGDYHEQLNIIANKTTWACSFRSYRNRNKQHPQNFNPLHDQMVEMNLYNNKHLGIPQRIFNSSVQDRLAFIAGFIDADGSYNPIRKGYCLGQGQANYLMLVHLRQITISLAIRTTSIYTQDQVHRDGVQRRIHSFFIYGRRLVDLQPYLITKKIPENEVRRHFLSDDTKMFKVTGNTQNKRFIDIEVEGKIFQLGDGTLMHDSTGET